MRLAHLNALIVKGDSVKVANKVIIYLEDSAYLNVYKTTLLIKWQKPAKDVKKIVKPVTLLIIVPNVDMT